nr:zinc-binding dehydrogenase [Kibdelosporangium sp. MJ126-NF4]CEL13884.1 putative Zinc-containing dehydrogenase [Kibdelosporangium sp. MJ126-NF4]CTQ88252.1 putative Zinc-containing dehydrogenase [Kibdelosporangium sp. MJ126-NF4]
MRAWRLTAIGQPLTLTDLPDPVAGPGEVVLRTMAAGLCLTDVSFSRGTLPGINPPIVLGHEIAGVITQVGPDVHAFAVGDRVAVRTGMDAPGVVSDGGFGTLVRTPAERLVAVPDSVSFPQAAVATDAGLSAYHALHDKGGLRAGMKVGVVSIGGLGSFGVQIAAAAGADVTAVVRKPALAPVARQLGATTVVRGAAELAGLDLDLVVDFAGYSETIVGAVDGLRHGGRVVVVGVEEPVAHIPIGLIVGKNAEIVGSNAGTNDELRRVLAMIGEHTITPLITTIAFADIPGALDRLALGGIAGRLAADLTDD